MMVTLMTLIGATIRIFVQNFENIEFFVNLRMSAKDHEFWFHYFEQNLEFLMNSILTLFDPNWNNNNEICS